MSTLAEVRSAVYNIINELQTSNVYDIDFVDDNIDEMQTKVCAMGKWSFLRKKVLNLAATPTTLSSAITTASTTVSVADTTNYATSGSVLCEHDIIAYTGKTATSLTGVTGITITHSAGAKVWPLISAPTDYLRQPEMRTQAQGSSRIRDWIFDDEYAYDNAYADDVFSLLTNDSGESFFWYNGNALNSGDIVMLHYIKKPTPLSASDTVLTVPDPYGQRVIARLVAADLLLIRGDDVDGLGTTLQANADKELLAMKKYYGEREQGIRSMARPLYSSGRTYPSRMRSSIFSQW